ncbi:MAG: hypothetical protein A2Y62_03540 [Candidatus Fischerbacteria bacterium RBG_13_37_8]|uniref:Uncharacterized protein n=1 Tax=Candidatus Fischerbacteria bacterium RBG_13_37_8 TaxID=1817863 RepID=A0A1F5VK97_9BACT|nr:MAG: hypothetical protein A2Y62_03540 [Candidatus Fischerbacteria bacterium RBG_13_37_8]
MSVFASSAFRDMLDDRDYLVLYIFPELRCRRHERKVDFVEVDLPWGITEEQAECGEVLHVCLAKIQK